MYNQLLYKILIRIIWFMGEFNISLTYQIGSFIMKDIHTNSNN